MITDSTYIEITTESEIGEYRTTKEIAVFLYRRPDGSCFIRLADGTEFVTKPTTVVKELKCLK